MGSECLGMPVEKCSATGGNNVLVHLIFVANKMQTTSF